MGIFLNGFPPSFGGCSHARILRFANCTALSLSLPFAKIAYLLKNCVPAKLIKMHSEESPFISPGVSLSRKSIMSTLLVNYNRRGRRGKAIRTKRISGRRSRHLLSFPRLVTPARTCCHPCNTLGYRLDKYRRLLNNATIAPLGNKRRNTAGGLLIRLNHTLTDLLINNARSCEIFFFSPVRPVPTTHAHVT